MQTPEFKEKQDQTVEDIRAGRCYTAEELDAYILEHTHKETPEGRKDRPAAP